MLDFIPASKDREWTRPKMQALSWTVRRNTIWLSRVFGLSIAVLHSGRGPVWRCEDRGHIAYANLKGLRSALGLLAPVSMTVSGRTWTPT